jgi:hypothetical protein
MIKNQDWQGEVEYEIRTEKEKVVERGAIPIPDWNTFWAGFNSGSYLYDFTVKALNFNVELPNLENDFTN